VRKIGVVAFAQAPSVRREERRNEVEMLMPVVAQALDQAGMTKADVDFTVSGSCDFLAGAPFSFVTALDAIGPWPPIQESHVEMDGAWALYEAWVRLQHGDIDVALAYAFGKSSTTSALGELLALQLDPYCVAPLWPDAAHLAAMQARLLLEDGVSERDMADVVARSWRSAINNPNAQVRGALNAEALLKAPYLVAPLRKHDCPPISDSAVAVILAADDRAGKARERPAWITGIDHRIEAQSMGARNLTESESTARAGKEAGAFDGVIDVAELHAPFSHQELILRDALGLDDSVRINPSGGALCANPIMSAGLIRIGEAARAVWDGKARRALAHATSGPCLQQNLVAVLEA
jgi:acetyl-CoA acetyltransferase